MTMPKHVQLLLRRARSRRNWFAPILMMPVPYARYALWDDLEEDSAERTWTDDYSNIIGVLRWWQERKRHGWGR